MKFALTHLQLHAHAAGHGMTLDVMSPGDGARRYQFLKDGAKQSPVLKGPTEATVWLYGYGTGKTDAEAKLEAEFKSARRTLCPDCSKVLAFAGEQHDCKG